jgi:hypothetical protein
VDHPVFGQSCAGGCEQRYGLGGFGLGRLEVVPGGGRLGVGVQVRYTRARLSWGNYLPRVIEAGVTDHWVQVGGTMSVRF